jgi:hypothetical protein
MSFDNKSIYLSLPEASKDADFNSQKNRWKEPKTNYKLRGGGIIFYDDKGIWVVAEYSKKTTNGLIITDIGGTYNQSDGNIYATISRELSEETYHTCELTTSTIRDLYKTSNKIYNRGYDKKPDYVCLLVDLRRINFKIDVEKLKNNRDEIIEQNDDQEPYRTANMIHISYDKIALCRNFSSRLRNILSSPDIYKFWN